jgi:hypothetical protein
MQESLKGNNGNFLWRIATLASIIAAFGINVAANIFPLNGLSIGAISNTIFKDVLIIPANYAFIIWGLIYLGLFAFGIYQILPSQRNESYLRKTGFFVAMASIAQIFWVYLFLSRLFTLSLLAMVLILLPLIAAYLSLDISRVSTTNIRINISKWFKWCVRFPISIYLGWISVATIVNVACALSAQNWNGWGVSSENWAIIMAVVATIVSLVVILQRRDVAYSGVSVWALVAIAVKHWDFQSLRIVALLGAFVLFILMLVKSPSLER